MISSIPDSQNADGLPADECVPISAWIAKPAQPENLPKTIERLTNWAHTDSATASSGEDGSGERTRTDRGYR